MDNLVFVWISEVDFDMKLVFVLAVLIGEVICMMVYDRLVQTIIYN